MNTNYTENTRIRGYNYGLRTIMNMGKSTNYELLVVDSMMAHIRIYVYNLTYLEPAAINCKKCT